MLTAEEEKMEVVAIEDSDNVVEINHGYFGWNVQLDESENKHGVEGWLISSVFLECTHSYY